MPDCRERILSNNYSDLLIDFVLSEEYLSELSGDYCFHKLEDDLGILFIQRNTITNVEYAESVYSFVPKCYALMQEESVYAGNNVVYGNLNTLSLSAAGILSVQNPPLNLTGRNVVIGFIGTGINYQNPVFRDSTGKSRIISIWDQTIQTGQLPDGFQYGTEYTNEMINEALISTNPLSIVPSTDQLGYGSVIASVASASSFNDGQFIGAAPDSQIVVVKLKEAKQYLRDFYRIPNNIPCYSETDILQAIQYLQKFAKVFERPLVVCIAVGTSMGDHTGSGILGRYIDYWCNKKNRAFVICAGNEGNAAHHYQGEITIRQPYKDVELRVGENENGFTMELWGEAPYFYNVVIRSPGGESISWNNPRSFIAQEYNFVFENTKISIDSLLSSQESGAQLIRFRFVQPTQGVWNIRVNSTGNIIGGKFDLWLPVTPFLSEDTYFLEPSPYITITEPGYVQSAITVTAYQSSNNSIYALSGRGFSRNNLVVPDIAAPGVNVSSAFGEVTGTDISAAIAAGGCAQLLEWAVIRENDILVNSINVKNYLIRGAKREKNLEYPNMEWGYGRLDIQGVFEFLAGF